VAGHYSLTTGVTLELTVTPPDTERIVVTFEQGGVIYEKEATLDSLNGTYTTDNGNPYTVASTPIVSVLPDGTYKVVALAIDAAGNSTPEIVTSVLTIDTVAPEASANLQVTAKTPNSITLNWTASGSADIVGYKVYYGTEPGVYTGVRDVGNVTTSTISGLNPLTKYYFMVKAYDKAGNDSLSSNEVSETTPAVLSRGGMGGSGSSVSSSGTGGIVESAQAQSENKEDKNKEEEQKAQTKGKNNLFWIALIILVLGLIGYYYYNENPDRFKNIKFPKLPGIK